MTPEQAAAFSRLFVEYRQRTRLKSLERFGDALAESGFVFDNSTFSHWQRGTRVPRDRRTLLGIVKTLYQYQGIKSPQEANVLLAAADNGYLSPTEEHQIFSDTY